MAQTTTPPSQVRAGLICAVRFSFTATMNLAVGDIIALRVPHAVPQPEMALTVNPNPNSTMT